MSHRTTPRLRLVAFGAPIVVILAAACSGRETAAPTTGAASTTASSGAGGGDGGSAPQSCTLATEKDVCGASSTCAIHACENSACVTKFAPATTACTSATGTQCDGFGSCVPAHCNDGAMSGNETGIDCGGSCAPCKDGSPCTTNADCLTEACLPDAANPGKKVCGPCTGHSTCDADHYCDATTMRCRADRKNGQACSEAAQCPGSNCVDGVCCDSACTDVCSACSAKLGASSDGTCTAKAVVDAERPGVCDATNGSCGGACICDAKSTCTKATTRAIASGMSHTCALNSSGKIKCWGSNSFGQLGLGDTKNRGTSASDMGAALPYVDLGTNAVAIAIRAGATHSCALLDTGKVKCWGRNNVGQLGLGDTVNRGEGAGQMGDALPDVDLGTNAKATAIAAGGGHTCALLDGGVVKCWGWNQFGQLGQGDQVQRGSGAGELGDALPPVALGTGQQAIGIVAGDRHACAVLAGGNLKCWGINSVGQLGLGDQMNRGEGSGQMGDALPFLSFGANAVVDKSALGFDHSCVRLADANVRCWGGNARGQLGIGSTGDVGKSPGGLAQSPNVDFGSGKSCEVLALGDSHSCAVLSDGSVKCWGDNKAGQLGQGDTTPRGTVPGDMGDALPAIDLGTSEKARSVSAGAGFSCAVFMTGTIKCWGLSSGGRLGLGDTQDRGSKPGDMGMNLPFVDLGTW